MASVNTLMMSLWSQTLRSSLAANKMKIFWEVMSIRAKKQDDNLLIRVTVPQSLSRIYRLFFVCSFKTLDTENWSLRLRNSASLMNECHRSDYIHPYNTIYG